MVLHPDRAAFGPFAIRPEGDVADDRVERMAVDVLGELVLVESVGRLDRIAEDL